MTDYIDLTQTKVAVDELGDLWINFENCLVPETAIIFNTAYNFITMAVKESTLPLDITTILINESLDVPNIVNQVRETFLIFIVDVLNEMGIYVDKNHIDSDSLPALINILDTVYSTDGVEDVMGLLWVLENDSFSNKEKVIEVIKRIHDIDDDENYPDIIADVSPDVIKGLMIGLGVDIVDEDDYIDPSIRKRVRTNREFLKGTFAESHIIDGGMTGLSYQVISNIFINDLAEIMVKDHDRYYKEVLSLLLISSMTDVEIETSYEVMVKDFAADLDELYKASALLEEVTFE